MLRDAAAGIDALANLAYRSYSGRGMNGVTCAAIEGDNIADLAVFGASLAYVVAQSHRYAEDGVEAIDDAISVMRPRVDSLGLGFVAYWPSVPDDGGEG